MLNGGQRLHKIDAVKGLGIILMVIGHSGCPVASWIYLFHMALFFVASGLLFNLKNSESLEDVKSYLLRKLESLWVPYVVANLIFLALHNSFIYVGVYTNDPSFLNYTGKLDVLFNAIDIKDFLKNALKNFFVACLS